MAAEKLLIEICVGTTCFILGASSLQMLEEFLPDELKGKVEIVGAPCLGCCRNRNEGQAPFVRLGGTKIVGNATVQSVINEIIKLLKTEAEYAQK